MRIIVLFSILLWPYLGYAQDVLLAQAKQLYEAEKYSEAIKLLDGIVDEERTLEALQLKGDCYQKEEKYVAAIQTYQKARQAGNESALLSTNQGAAYLNLQQYREAEKMLKSALKIDSKLPETHYFLGNLKYAEFNTNAALKHYNEAIRLKPLYRDALYMRAAAHAELGKYKLAMNDYEAALAIDPSLTVAKFNIAVLYLQNDQFEKAAEILASINPESLANEADYYYSLGESLYFAGQREEACEAYKSAMELGDEESKTIYLRYCVNKEERDELLRTRTIRMAF